jgi:hypothetical protein
MKAVQKSATVITTKASSGTGSQKTKDPRILSRKSNI